MADDRIKLDLDLGNSVESAKQLGAAMQTTKVDTTALGAALQSLDVNEVKLVAETTALQLALEKLGPTQVQAARATGDFAAALNRLEREEIEAEAETKRLAMETQRLADEAMDKVTRAAIEQTQAQRAMNQILAESSTHTSTAAVGLGKVEASGKAAGLGVLSASYAFQDFTSVLSNGGGFARALGSIQNNIPLLLAGFGVGAGLTGVISAASVAVGIMIDNFGKLHAAWGDGETEEEIARMEKLGKATEAANDAIKKQIEAMRAKEKAGKPEAAEIATAAIAEAGGVDEVIKAVKAQLTGESKEIKNVRAEIARLQAITPGNEEQSVVLGGQIREQQARLKVGQDAIQGAAEDVAVRASQGDPKAIAELARRFPRAAFGQATPEAIRAQDQEVEDVGAEGDRLHRAGQARRRARGLVDDLNAEGRSNEAAMGRGEQADAAAQRARAIANARAAGKGIVPDTRGKEIGRIQQEMARNNTTTQKLMERGFDVTGQTQQQIAEVQAINAQLANRLRLLEQGSRKIQTRMGRVR